MRKRFYIASLILAAVLFSGCGGGKEIYRDPSASIDKRTKDLVGRMTLEEKVGQLMCPYGWEMYVRKGDSIYLSDTFKEAVGERKVGMLWATFRADPWTRRDYETGLTPATAARLANMMQRYVIENTRLGIPMFLAEEAPHGHMAIGATVFPTALGQASTWNPELIEEMGSVISEEIRLQGGHISYGPVLDIARDPRWSRVEESYGEDPELTSRMGEAFVMGAGSADLSRPNSTVSTLKHFFAYGVSEAGQNGGSQTIGPREIKRVFLPPFRAAVDAGARSVMTAYNSVDGVPCTSNAHMLKEVLRDEWGFDGFVISDLLSIEGLWETHNVAATKAGAAALALQSGVDADLRGDAFHTLIESVRAGKVSERLIDRAVSRVLRLKFEMGLFENPYVDEQAAAENVRNSAHRNVAYRVAAESITLLENNGILPLSKSKGKVAVIGPNADNIYNQLGDYTAQQDDTAADGVVTVLKGISDKIGADRVIYAKGCAVRDTGSADIPAAVRAAKQADVAVVVVGGSSARDFKTSYLDTGAATVSSGSVSDMESGEGFDRAALSLLGKQEELLRAVKAVGKPMIVVYIQGRPLDMAWASENADALLCAWYPGQEGGAAVADAIFGELNPAGRLPISIPRSEGQIPVYYNRLRPANHDYVEMPAAPLYPFGHGLSYTGFEYVAMNIIPRGDNSFAVDVTVRNTGAYDGDEVVQLYLRDEEASTVQPLKQLRAFERIDIRRGEERTIRLRLFEEDFRIVDSGLRETLEPGDFTVLVGASSEDIRLMGKISIQN